MKQLITLVHLILIFATAHALAGAFYLWAIPGELPPMAADLDGAESHPGPPDSPHGDPAIQPPPRGENQSPSNPPRDLFNTHTPAAKMLAIRPPAKPTRLKLKLKGTVVGTAHPLAFIQSGREARAKIYREKDRLGSAIIQEIRREEVILLVNGQRESLPMKTLKFKGKKNLPAPPLPRAQGPK